MGSLLNDAILETEERYRPLLNASPDGIAILDLEGRVLMASRMSLKMLGCEREDELVGRPITDFIVPEERKTARTRIGRCRRWWGQMSEVMPSNPDNSPVSRELREVFHIER